MVRSSDLRIYFSAVFILNFYHFLEAGWKDPKKLGTSAILFVRRSSRTGPAGKGSGSSVEMGWGTREAEYGFNLGQDSAT